jgi:hypothetical protein
LELSAFEARPFVPMSEELARFWPALSPGAIVFRLEPRAFTGVAGYVVARSVRLVTGLRAKKDCSECATRGFPLGRHPPGSTILHVNRPLVSRSAQ